LDCAGDFAFFLRLQPDALKVGLPTIVFPAFLQYPFKVYAGAPLQAVAF
jgi:hypothetical protein